MGVPVGLNDGELGAFDVGFGVFIAKEVGRAEIGAVVGDCVGHRVGVAVGRRVDVGASDGGATVSPISDFDDFSDLTFFDLAFSDLTFKDFVVIAGRRVDVGIVVGRRVDVKPSDGATVAPNFDFDDFPNFAFSDFDDFSDSASSDFSDLYVFKLLTLRSSGRVEYVCCLSALRRAWHFSIQLSLLCAMLDATGSEIARANAAMSNKQHRKRVVAMRFAMFHSSDRI